MQKKDLKILLTVMAIMLALNTAAWAGTAILSWDPNTESDLAGYKVYYGTASVSYTQIVDVGLTGTPATPQYTMNNLMEGQTYFFAVTAYNTSGNESGYSNEVSKTILDTTAPVLSGITATNITSTGATITWATNELATSQVEYDTTTAYGLFSALNSTLATSHNRTLGSLSPSITYHYRVISKDAAGNTATSGDNTFTTSAAPDTTPPSISAITASNITSTSTTITWDTNEAATSQVEYGTNTAYGLFSTLNSTLVTSHSRTLSGLLPSTTYHYRVISKDAAGNIATSGDNTFITSAAPDTTPPVISGVTASNITSTSATITWATNEPATSQVEYGTTTAYGSFSSLNSTFVTSHSQSLSGLAPSVTYHYRVISKDAAANTTTSGDNTFITSAAPDSTPPIISSVTTSNITSTSATVAWSTNEAATSQVEYGTTTAYGSSSILNSTLVTSHSTTLSGLLSSTTYHYRVISKDAAGNTATSGDNTFITSTAPDTTPPTISGVTASSITSTSATIAWSTNEAATSQVQYGTTTSYGSSSTLNATLVTSHITTLTNLAPSSTYHYRVISKDAAGNVTTSGDNTFTTTAVPDTTPPMDISDFNAAPGNEQVQLSWLTPPDLDFKGVRIQFRTDGTFPANPQDGELVGDFTGQPMTNGTYLHTGLYNGTTYYYAAFSYDTSGNYSQTVYAQATPQTLTPDNLNKVPGFGCGRIQDISGGTGPNSGQILVNFLIYFLLLMLIKTHRRLRWRWAW